MKFMLEILILSLVIFNFIIYYNYDSISKFINIYDKPDNKRKIHKNKIPLTGGILIFANIIFILTIHYFYPNLVFSSKVFAHLNNFYLFLFSIILIFLIGLLDDKYNISANKKLLLLLIVLCLILIFDKDLVIRSAKLSFTNYELQFGNFSFIWTLICFLLFINAFNMIDGINLQSGIYSIVVALVFIFLQYETLFFISLLIPLFLFLYLNKKNKSFLGNSGSYLLPFIYSYFFIKFYNYDNNFHADLIVVVMIIPGIDLIRLFFLRILNKRNPFSADNNHLHHILLKKVGYTQTLYAIQGAIIIPIVFGLIINNYLFSLILAFLIYLYLFFKNN